MMQQLFSALGVVDSWVVIIYILAIIGIGVYCSHFIKDTKDFSSAGQSLGLFVIVGATLSSFFGAYTGSGGLEVVHNSGLAGFTICLLYTSKAVTDVINKRFPDREIKVANAEGLKECRKLLTMAKAGKYNGYLLEGMACPGGCVAGAGTMQPIKKSQAAVNLYASKAKHKTSNETEHVKELNKLVD